MLVFLSFYRRRPDLSWQQYSDHWRNVHGPLIRDTPALSRYMRRYVQHHLQAPPSFPNQLPPGTPPLVPLDFDGMSENWIDSEDDVRKLLAEPAWQRVLADEKNFLDMSATRAMMLDQQVVQLGTGPAVRGGVVQFI
jgi:uncharacterized protein (TIGR02118 family)